VIDEISKTAKLTKDFGVSMISYEGGQGLVDWATRDYMQHPNPLFFGANRDPRMGKLYEELYHEWRKMGADLFVSFASPRSCNADGCWGLKEHIRKPLNESPKLQASLAFMQQKTLMNNPKNLCRTGWAKTSLAGKSVDLASLKVDQKFILEDEFTKIEALCLTKV